MKIVIDWEKGKWVVTFNGRITRFWDLEGPEGALAFVRECISKIPREAP